MSAQVKVWVGCASHKKMKEWSQQPNKMMVSLVGKDWLRTLLKGCYSGLKSHRLTGKANGVTLPVFS